MKRLALAGLLLTLVVLIRSGGPDRPPVVPAGEAKTLIVYPDFDGVLVPCLVDTGATFTTVRAVEAARMLTLGPTVGAARLAGAGGQPFVGQIRRIPVVRLPGFVWPDVDLVVVQDAELPLPCLLGGDVLGRQRVLLDYPAGLVLPVGPAAGAATVAATPAPIAAPPTRIGGE